MSSKCAAFFLILFVLVCGAKTPHFWNLYIIAEMTMKVEKWGCFCSTDQKSSFEESITSKHQVFLDILQKFFNNNPTDRK